MPNLSQKKRQRMLDFLEDLKKTHTDDASICAFNEIENHIREKKFGLVFEQHTEAVDEMLQNNIPVFCEDPERRICKDKTLPWNFIIEGDNLQALYLLQKTHKGKVDCIYIDPPYNTGAKDWKYNNDYVDSTDTYRHSKWLSMMESRLKLAKELLNPKDSVLICTIDEKEYMHLGCLLEEMFPNAQIQMISSVISHHGAIRTNEFSRVNEFIYFVMIGDYAIAPFEDSGYVKEGESIHWQTYRRSSPSNIRPSRPSQFYPIYVEDKTGRIVEVGDPIAPDVDRFTVKQIEGCTAVFPVRDDGTEMMWSWLPSVCRNNLAKGYIKAGRHSPDKPQQYSIQYLMTGTINDIESGKIKIHGFAADGSVIAENLETKKILPKSQWDYKTHDARDHGTKILRAVLGELRFSFPKSLYAVHDCIRFFVADKPNALIVDFFAGSGTTLHAVNLLNAEDGGRRRCIMITNNEVSLEDAKKLTEQGFQKGDPEWEALGIAKYVTWPRTVCSIEGHDIKGNALKGDYGVETERYEPDDGAQLFSKTTGKPIRKTIYRKVKCQQYPALAKIKKSDGFVCNVKYFKCGWTPRKPEDYLLSNALCLHTKEMIELQSGIEVDNGKNVLILNKEDFRKYVTKDGAYQQIENIWVNQNILFNSEEMERLNAIGFRYIPKEFFGQELKEAAE